LGPGVNTATIMLQLRGEGYLRRLIEEQDIALTRDPRQGVEFVVRGRYPIGLGMTTAVLESFRKEGLGTSVEGVDLRDVSPSNPGFGTVSIFNNAPHPNAATVFVNWLLSREGQAGYAQATLENSRRTDVAPSNPSAMPVPGADHINLQKEEYAPVRGRAAQIAREAAR
jgi:iron(III) transport system substrate-binding protein